MLSSPFPNSAWHVVKTLACVLLVPQGISSYLITDDSSRPLVTFLSDLFSLWKMDC